MKILCILYLLFGFSINVYAAPVELKVAYEDKTQFPYYIGNTEDVLDKPGVAVEMVKLLEKKIPNFVVKFKRYPWKRCLSNLEIGTVDAIFNASFNKPRMKIGRYPWKNDKVDTSRRITVISYSFYKRQQSKMEWNGEVVSNLDGLVGAPRGYSIVNDLKKLGLEIDESPWTLNDFKKLMRNRISAVAAQDVTATFLLNKHKEEFSTIVRLMPPIKVKPYYLMLSHQFVKKHPKKAEQIWDAIKEIREEQFDRLSEKYFSDN